MKTRSVLPWLFSSFALFAGAIAFGAGPKADAASAAKAAATPAPKPKEPAVKTPEGWPVLKKGTPAEDVLRMIGKPDSITPMATKGEGKAEVWSYRRLVRHWTQQSAVGTESVPAFTGIGLGNDSSGTATVPTYRLEEVSIYQVSSLLMFDGKLVAATQKGERESHFRY